MEDKKQELHKKIIEMDLIPEIVDMSESDLKSYSKIPLADILALGASFVPVFTIFKGIAQSAKHSNLYRVTIPKLSELEINDDGSGSGGLGTLFNSGRKLAGRFTSNPTNTPGSAMKYNPQLVVIAAALIMINKKLDTISQTQKTILAFLEKKEEASLSGNLKTLSKILTDYKYNWDNEHFRNNNHISILKINQEATASMELYKSFICSSFSGRSNLHTHRDVKTKKTEIYSYLGNYQLAVYLYCFSLFLEVLLIENFEKEYVDGVIENINHQTMEYREVFSEYSAKVEKYSDSTAESTVIKHVSKAGKFLGKQVSKVKIIDGTKINDGINFGVGKLEQIKDSRNEKVSTDLAERRSVDVKAFTDNLSTISMLYNDSVELLFDEENIYIAEK